ncbi:MAG: hypothetical protein ACOYWZ_11060, partial [Bacillota bacterium]
RNKIEAIKTLLEQMENPQCGILPKVKDNLKELVKLLNGDIPHSDCLRCSLVGSGHPNDPTKKY